MVFDDCPIPPTRPKVHGPVLVTPEEETRASVTLSDLLAAGLLETGDLLIPVDPERETIAEVTDEALIALDEHTYDSPPTRRPRRRR